MGGSSWSTDNYTKRLRARASSGYATAMTYTADIAQGKVAAKVHPLLEPKGVTVRESRDSKEHPIAVPIAIFLDTTGSMAEVPEVIEASLPKLLGGFTGEKKYIGDGYPAIFIGAIDDYDAMRGAGSLQAGQFESGIEIDQMIENIWLTKAGGCTYEESYDLALYFMARHSAHDHWDKRGRKGHLFLIGDEHPYPKVRAKQVQTVIGDDQDRDLTFKEVLDEARQLYHVYFVIPNMTNHYNDEKLYQGWVEKLGQQNVLKLEDPKKICELIIGAVTIKEEYAGLDALKADGIVDESLAVVLSGLEPRPVEL